MVEITVLFGQIFISANEVEMEFSAAKETFESVTAVKVEKFEVMLASETCPPDDKTRKAFIKDPSAARAFDLPFLAARELSFSL